MVLSIAEIVALHRPSVTDASAVQRALYGWRCRTTDHVRVLNSAMPAFRSATQTVLRCVREGEFGLGECLIA
jgi:hypothetical protein